MVSTGAETRKPVECDKLESVLAAIEAGWKEHHAEKPGFTIGLYLTLARILNEEGVVVDTLDGLDVLEHCRRLNLPIVDILYAIEERVHKAGYLGRLGLADFAVDGKPVYAFYDTARFKTFAELKQKIGTRVALSNSAEFPTAAPGHDGPAP